MYAIILDGSRQLKVEEGQELVVDCRTKLNKGDALKFEKVLAIGGQENVKLGASALEGAIVEAEVVGLVQGPKMYVQHFRRRKNSRRKTGHRQVSTRVRIKKISV
jgi:large subunit ribosomal protein L21